MGLWRIAGIAVIARNRRDRGGCSAFFGSTPLGAPACWKDHGDHARFRRSASGGLGRLGWLGDGRRLPRRRFVRFLLRRLGRWRRGFHLRTLLGVEIADNLRYIGPCFAIRRHAVILLHAIGAGVVRGQSLNGIVVVEVQELTQIGCTAFYVGFGIRSEEHTSE